MEFSIRAKGRPERLGILSGAFNPPTRAHLALARAALGSVDEVLFVLPRELPHKRYGQVGFGARLEMLLAAAAGNPRFSVAASEGGLFIDIAREAGAAYGDGTKLFFLCGTDAAERIAAWDYGPAAGTFKEQLEAFDLLVARRGGGFAPAPEVADRIHTLALEEDWSGVSATEVRTRIERGEPWEALVPEEAVSLVKRFYGGGR